MDESAVRRRSGIELPERVQRLLLGLVADGFTVYCCGPKHDPAVLVAAYQWPGYVDLVTIRDFDRLVSAARVPARDRPVDIFAPEVVVWACEGTAEYVLAAALELVHPDHPAAPATVCPAPVSLTVPRRGQRPMSIRYPPPGRVGARAARLAAHLSEHAGAS